MGNQANDNSFQNYSLDAFFNPTIIEIQKVVLDSMLVLSTLLFPLLIYLLIFRSSRLEFYRYLLLFNVISDYSSDVALTLIQPVFLFSSLAWYANGVFSDLGIFILKNVGKQTLNSRVERKQEQYK